jgi:hypothetical protein
MLEWLYGIAGNLVAEAILVVGAFLMGRVSLLKKIKNDGPGVLIEGLGFLKKTVCI